MLELDITGKISDNICTTERAKVETEDQAWLEYHADVCL